MSRWYCDMLVRREVASVTEFAYFNSSCNNVIIIHI